MKMILRKRKTAPASVPMAKVKIRATVKHPTCNMVKPNCVQDRYFDVQVKNLPGIGGCNATITEIVSDSETQSVSLSREVTVSLCSREDKNRYGRIIGKPLVIGCRDDHLILQYISLDHPFFRFAYVDTKTCTCQIIQDEVNYHRKHFYLQGPVECYISPDMTYALFRVPQPLRPFSKGCKLLKARLSSPDTSPNDDICMRIEPNFSDLRFQLMMFNERKLHHLIIVTVNRYCSKCCIEEYDITDFHLLKSTKLSIHEAIYQSSPSSGDVQTLDGINTRNLVLLQCAATLSKAKTEILICSYNKIAEVHMSLLKVGIFNSESFHLRKSYMFLLDHNITIEGIGFPNFFVPQTDLTDQKVSVWFHEREKFPVKLSVDNRMPQFLHLQMICRQVILRNCSSLRIHRLPLPTRIIDYLLFRSSKPQYL